MIRLLRPAIELALGLAALSLPAAVQAQSSPSPYTTAMRYDNMGRVTGAISPDPDTVGSGNPFLATRNTYDGRGNLAKVESGTLSSWKDHDIAPLAWGTAFTVLTTTEATYNGRNQKLTETLKGSNGVAVSLKQYSYDSHGRLECTAVRMNPAVYGNPLPLSACEMGSRGLAPNDFGPDRITKNVYDAAGQLLQIREGVGTTGSDAAEAAEVTYTYTPNGKLKYVIDAAGNRAELCYDAYDRQSRWIFPSTIKPGTNGTPVFNDATPLSVSQSWGGVNGSCTGTNSTWDYEEYGYDPNSNRTSLRKRDSSTLIYEFDFLNRMTRKVVPDRAGLDATHERDVHYSYDLRGLMTSARFDSTSGEGVIFDYDGFGRKITETVTMDGVPRDIDSKYDNNGNRVLITHPDNNSFNYQYDGLGRFHQAYVNGSGSNRLFYTPYDAAGRVDALHRWNAATDNAWMTPTDFNYNPVSRLSSIATDVGGTSYDTSTSFEYNPASQIISQKRTNDTYAWNGAAVVNRNYTANGLNEYSAVAGTGFTYDANGNLTSDGVDTYSYDIENRMVGRVTPTLTYTFRYDPLGRFYEYGSNYSGTQAPTRRYYYDGDALTLEYNIDGSMAHRYIHGAGAGDDPLVWFSGSSIADTARKYWFADERGSIIAVTDSAGTIVSTLKYDEYGIPAAGNGSRFQYTGQAWHPAFGMYYYKARLYSPTLGRFMQTDPIGYKDQFNLYAYVGNDPVNGIDPGGEDGFLVARPAYGAHHTFIVISDRPGGRIEAIFSYTDEGPALSLNTPLVVAPPGHETYEKRCGRLGRIRK